MALVTCLGADVLRGEVHIPLRGVWWANLQLDSKTAPALKTVATLAAANGASLTGVVAKAGVFQDTLYTHVVGGAGGAGLVVGPFAYQSAIMGDPLNAILSAARETLSSSVSTAITRLQLGTWTCTQKHAARLLDELCWAASQTLGAVVNWRTLADGTTWMGVETWPTQSLPAGADVTWQHPVNPWFEVSCETPTLLPGVNLTDIGGLNVSGVDYWIEPAKVRQWVWTT
jgi:hypothetical protein